MSPIYELIQADKSPREVMEAISNLPQRDLDFLAESLDDHQVTYLGKWTVKTLQTTGVETRLYYGGFLHYYKLTTDRKDRAELFQNICDELGLKTNRAQDHIVVFRTWSQVLLAEPKLMQWFPTASLRLLAVRSAPQSARDAAIEMARRGIRVTIPVAEELLIEHASDAVQTDECELQPVLVTPRKQRAAKTKAAPGRGHRNKSTRKVFSHTEADIHVIVESANPKARINPALIIPVLERALIAYRELCQVTEANLLECTTT